MLETPVSTSNKRENRNSLKHNNDGFTGLEAGIILIAFVTVAAVFAYMVQGAGFFVTQKAQSTVYSGVQQATSSVELSGPVSVHSADGSTIDNITFYLQLAGGGDGVDMSKVTYTVFNSTQIKSFTNLDVTYTWVKQNGNHDTEQSDHAGQLGAREMVLVKINPEFGANMGTNTKFLCEVKPPIGAVLPITRTIPAGLTPDQWYEVY